MAVPERIGRFEVEGRIGGGAFATVWRAHDEALESDVAIKVLSENWLDSADVRARFLAEARLLRRAESDRVVRVHDLGELDDGRPYLVMTYADKGTLDERLADGRFSWRVAVDVAVEIGKGLVVLHAAGVLHRDVKPSNILYRSTPGGGEQVLLGDLGLGKLLAEASMLTLAGGTPAYMAPEQAQPGAPVSVRTDIYGLAALLYRLLTGRTAHDSSTLAAVADPGRTPVTAPSSLVGDIPQALDQVVLRALSPEPDRRQPDVETFVRDLRSVLDNRTPSAGLTLAGPTRFTPGPEETMPVHHSAIPRPVTPPRGVPQRPTTPPAGMPGPRQQTLRYGGPQQTYPPTPQRGQPVMPPPAVRRPVPQGPPQRQQGPQPRRRRRRWVVVVAVLVVLAALAGGGGYWYYLQQPVDVINDDGQVRISVPRDWAVRTANGWHPNVLLGGPDQGPAPGALAAVSDTEFPNTTSDKAGVFAGLLPSGAQLDGSTFLKKVTAPGCTKQPNAIQVSDVVQSVLQQCGTLLLNDVLMTRKGRLVWVRVKQPTTDTTNATDIVNNVQISPT